jgi:catechol 2,3-dioxygenase-like lactoylglutathione lyase family enzyme
MSSTQGTTVETMATPGVATDDMKLEVVVIPVSDVDRAKRFYGSLGWRLDADFAFDNGFRVVQFTPPGSACSIQFGSKITSARPGSAQGLYLVVSDIEAARNQLGARGVNVSEVFHAETPGAQFNAGDTRGRVRGAAADHASYGSFAHSRIRTAIAGCFRRSRSGCRTRTQQRRCDADRSAARGREGPQQLRTDGSEARLVHLVRSVHRRSGARENSRGCSQRRDAVRRARPQTHAGVTVSRLLLCSFSP